VHVFKESNGLYYSLNIENLGPTPAHIVRVTRVLNRRVQPIPQEELTKQMVTSLINCLKVGERYALSNINSA
jgi:hypothetical protein